MEAVCSTEIMIDQSTSLGSWIYDSNGSGVKLSNYPVTITPLIYLVVGLRDQ